MYARWFIILTFTSAFVVSNVNAAPPWKIFKRKPSTNANNLRLSKDHGPWLVYAASFAGAGAETEAKRLAIELRRRYKMNAFIHSAEFDFTESVDGLGINPDRSRKKMKYNNSGTFNEIAVMVGNFSSINDPELQETMATIKYAQPESLVKAGDKTTRRFAGLRELHKRINGDGSKKKKGPMGRAFATPNPLIPREVYAPKGIDQSVVKWNKKVKHSLLKCPKKFSVRVATFRGVVVTNQQKVQEIENGGRFNSKLEEAAYKANKLTEALRKRGIEAYEFHDRHESYVTVGSFEWVGKPRRDGKQEMNPAVLRVIEKFGATQNSGGAQNVSAKPKRLNGISFDTQPWPVEVPRQSLAADYATGRRWLR